MIKMLLIVVFSVVFTFKKKKIYISSVASHTPPEAGSAEMSRMAGHMFKNIFSNACPPSCAFLEVSWEELGPTLQLAQTRGESHQIALVPGHLVLL